MKSVKPKKTHNCPTCWIEIKTEDLKKLTKELLELRSNEEDVVILKEELAEEKDKYKILKEMAAADIDELKSNLDHEKSLVKSMEDGWAKYRQTDKLELMKKFLGLKDAVKDAEGKGRREGLAKARNIVAEGLKHGQGGGNWQRLGFQVLQRIDEAIIASQEYGESK